MRMRIGLAALAAALSAAGAVHAQTIWINEWHTNAPGGSDGGREFMEIRSSTASASLAGLWFLVIEGDNSVGQAGSVDLAFDLSAFSTGTNGLFLLRDSAAVLQPPPDPATIVHAEDFGEQGNDNQTVLLVRNFTGTVGQDLDGDNDGLLDSVPWSATVDGVGFFQEANAGLLYAAQLGFPEFPNNLTFTPDAVLRLLDGTWMATDTTGPTFGPFAFDYASGEVALLDGSPVLLGDLTIDVLTPGSANPAFAAVPEPTTLSLIGVGLVGVGAKLRRRRGVPARVKRR